MKQQTTSLVQSLEGNNTGDYLKAIKVILPGGVCNFNHILDKGTSVSSMVINNGEKETVAILAVLLTKFSHSINVVRNLSAEQIKELAWDFVINDDWGFRLEDYVAAFQMAKNGVIGDIRDRLDIEVINDILDQYFTRRMAAIRERREQRVFSDDMPRLSEGSDLQKGLDRLTGHFSATKSIMNEQK